MIRTHHIAYTRFLELVCDESWMLEANQVEPAFNVVSRNTATL